MSLIRKGVDLLMARKKTHNEFVLQVNEIFGDKIEVLGTFIKTAERVLVKCKKCNHEWNPIANSLLQKHGCFECAKQEKTKTHEQFLNEVYNLVQDEYTILGIYKNTHIDLLIRHNCDKCNNYEYMVEPNSFLHGTRCPKCEGSMKKTHEEFIEALYNIVQDEYTVLEKYVDTHTKLLTRHNCIDCGNHEWKIAPHDLLIGVQCPKCASSKGEKRIAKDLLSRDFTPITNNEYNNFIYLNNINIFVPQKVFINLLGVGGRKLSYDIYIPKYNLLIEYQGKQHEKYVEYFHKSKEAFEIQLEHDRRKKSYAEQNNYHFLEIWYNQFDNIEQILESKLQELSNSQQDSSILIAK